MVQLRCRRSGKLRSFLSSAIAPNTFLRQAPLTVVVSSSAWWLQMRRYLVRIPRRRGHSNQSIVRFAAVGDRIHGGARVDLYGRDLNLPWQIGSNNLAESWLFLCSCLLCESCSIQASSSCHPSGLTPGRSEWPRRMTGRKKPGHQFQTSSLNM